MVAPSIEFIHFVDGLQKVKFKNHHLIVFSMYKIYAFLVLGIVVKQLGVDEGTSVVISLGISFVVANFISCVEVGSILYNYLFKYIALSCLASLGETKQKAIASA